jgi:hypothetical protein
MTILYLIIYIMSDDIKPTYEIDWGNLKYKHSTLNYIGRDIEPHFNTKYAEFFIANQTDYSIDAEKLKDVIQLGQTVFIDDIKEYIKPYYYNLCKYLGIKKIGCILDNERLGQITGEYRGNKYTSSSNILDRKVMHYPHYIKFNIIIDDNKSGNSYTIEITIPEEDAKEFIKNSFDSLYSEENLQKIRNIGGNQINIQDRRNGHFMYYTRIVFCSEEYGIYGHVINPKDLYPLDMGFIMSNLMNSATISDKLASQQMIISQLQTENDIFKSKIKHIEDILITNTELLKSITTHLSKKGGKKTRKIIKK